MAHEHPASKLKLIFRLIPIVGLLCIIAGFGVAIYNARFNVPAYAILGIGVLLYLTLFIQAEVANLKYYLHVFVYSILVLGICVVAYLFAQQYTHKIDLTEQKFYSLSQQSAKYFKNLNKQVKVTIFFPDINAFSEIINLYKNATDKVQWEVIDAKANPLKAREFGGTVKNGDIFIKCGEKSKKLQVTELQANYENILTNAIVEVTRAKSIKIYFLGGHGEIAYEKPATPRRERSNEPSLEQFRSFLKDRGLESGPLDLARTGSVPEDATLVIITGPKTDLLASEVAALNGYMQRDGKLMVLLDITPTDINVPQTNLVEFLKGYGVNVPNKIIVDLFSAKLVGNPVQPLVAWFNPDQPITRDLGSRESRSVLYSPTRPISATGNAPLGLTVTELIRSSEQSWSEDMAKVVASNGRIAPPKQAEMKGQPIAVAVSRETKPPETKKKGGMRMVVFGNSEFIQDDYLARDQMAVNLMLNSVNWLTEQEDLVAVPPRQLKGTPIVLDNAQKRVIFLFSAILIPAMMFFGGVSYAMWRRRK